MTGLLYIFGQTHPHISMLQHAFGLDIEDPGCHRLPSGEIFFKGQPNSGCQVVLWVTLEPNIVETFFDVLAFIGGMADHSGSLTIIMPYYSFGRCAYHTFLWDVLRMRGARLITLDAHDSTCLGSISPFGVWDQMLAAQDDLADTIIIAPDDGAYDRARTFARRHNLPFLSMHKIRNKDDGYVFQVRSDGEDPPAIAQKKCIIVDDVIDSGTTLWHCASMLRTSGAQNVIGFITHALCSVDPGYKWDGVLSDIWVSDTLTPRCPPGEVALHTIPCMPFLIDALSA